MLTILSLSFPSNITIGLRTAIEMLKRRRKRKGKKIVMIKTSA